MERRRVAALAGAALVGVGVVQAGSFGLQREWIPAVLGLLIAAIGVAYLWAEVYAADR